MMSLEDTELIDILVQNRKTRPKRRKGGKQRGWGGGRQRKRIKPNQRQKRPM